ncbi:MAG: UDP-3-O-[3-hydroxymyristoyl] N-acetylglucosamine deacetylase [Acidobacteria bacterium]|nr:MAG: UDP-3-O-[3-hydroxymyristoyl] N-acetylglucosamine deacetylase [Acidobacteriota bacterium]
MAETILIIDDEPGILGSVAGVLADEGYDTLVARNGLDGLELYRRKRPAVVFLDIWLPDRDGLEVLQALRELDPRAAVIMISGHGTVSTAVKSVRMGAYDYLEKPLSYNQVIEAVEGALRSRKEASDRPPSAEVQIQNRAQIERQIRPPAVLPIVDKGRKRQKTIKRSTVVYGLGLHSGKRTGMVLQPLPPDSGIHFLTLPAGKVIPATVEQVADTDYATTLARDGEQIKTVEHLLSALHACGVTNLFVKVHGEVPVLDGSALEFCKVLEEAGVESQRRARRELVIDRVYEVAGDGGKLLRLEPHDGFAVSYLLRYPPPIGEQHFEIELDSFATFKAEIAPAHTFGFMRDLKMMAELGLGSGGRLDNCILVGEDNVINTELRYPDEFVRHKILDVVGDLYLLGFPVRGKVTARLTGHRDNIAILRQILDRCRTPA